MFRRESDDYLTAAERSEFRPDTLVLSLSLLLLLLLLRVIGVVGLVLITKILQLVLGSGRLLLRLLLRSGLRLLVVRGLVLTALGKRFSHSAARNVVARRCSTICTIVVNVRCTISGWLLLGLLLSRSLRLAPDHSSIRGQRVVNTLLLVVVGSGISCGGSGHGIGVSRLAMARGVRVAVTMQVGFSIVHGIPALAAIELHPVVLAVLDFASGLECLREKVSQHVVVRCSIKRKPPHIRKVVFDWFREPCT